MSNRHSGSLVESSTLVDLLRWRAEQQPDQRIYTFLLDGEAAEAHLDCAGLDRQARAIGALLQEAGATGERALLLYPPGLDYLAAFFGCLYAGVVAVPVYPPNPARLDRTLPRLRAIAHDARPQVILTTTPILALAGVLAAHDPAFQALRWLATDQLAPGAEDAWRPPTLDGATLAFLQYTSGSTAAPKGVMLTHANLLHNSVLIRQCFAHTTASQGVIWLPPYHDMGLIGGIIQPLYAGFPVTLLSPVDFLQRPFRWLQAVSRYRATTSGGPNFAYDLCTRKITPEQIATLDLSSWQVAFNGAEPIRPETLDRFAATFAPCGFRREAFYPCYGLAEATLIVAGGRAEDPPVARAFAGAALERDQVIAVAGEEEGARVLVGSGATLPDHPIAVVERERRVRSGDGQVGEIWVRGPSVAQGYWEQPDATEATFRACLADSGEGPFLRTGDLGFLQDGELFITGRIKDLIIIRGRNHYPQDIELTVERSHPALRPGCGAAFAVAADGAERLVVVQEVERQHRNVDADTLIETVRQAVADQHELHVYGVVLLKPGSIPKTSSGKIQRHACRAAFLAGDLDALTSSILEDSGPAESDVDLSREALLALAPEERRTPLEAYLRGLVARVLNVAPSRVDPQRPVSGLGIDSLMAVELQHGIEADLGAVVPMVTFLQDTSIAQLAAELLDQLAAPAGSPVGLAPAQENAAAHPLSPGQQALWFLHQLAPESAAYTIASAVRIRGGLDVPALRRALQALVDRHPSLRTTFVAPQGTPLQQVHERAEVFFRQEDASLWSDAVLDDHLVAEAHRPFDLARGPLLRLHLFTRAPQEHVLLLAVHHIVSDLWSLVVLTHELGALYQAETTGAVARLGQLALTYTDYVYWQADMLARAEGQRLWAYWQQQLAGAPQVLNLPTDRPRPPVQTYNGALHAFRLDDALSRRLKALAEARGTTLYTLLLAAFQVLLYRYSGQEDILVGSPIAGRSRADLAGVVGYFVNSVVLRADLAGDPPFTALLDRMRRTVLEAFAHQDYPFVTLVERLQSGRDLSRSPLFQVMFALQKAHLLNDEGMAAFAVGQSGARMNVGGLPFEALPIEQRIAQFDMTLTMGEADGGLAASLEYNTDLFEAGTIGRMASHFRTLLEGIVADPTRRVADLPLLTEAEREQMLVEWNATAVDFPAGSCIHHLFEAQVEHTPDAVAVVCRGGQLTYRELNRRANRVARYLRALGVGPEALVGICLERSPEMMVGILGILKAGGAYVPLDPTYPAERLSFMLDDARAPVLLTSEGLGTWDEGRGARDHEPGAKPQTPSPQPLEGRGTWDEGLGARNQEPDAKPQTPSPQSLTSSPTPTVICLDRDWPAIAGEREENLDGRARAENVACVIYTSGSTGQPKGVLIKHDSVVNLVTSFARSYSPDTSDRILPLTSLASASFVGEIFPLLCTGGALVLPDSDEALDFERLFSIIAERNVTIVSTVPATIAGLNASSGDLPKPRLILSGGEALAARDIDRLVGTATIANGYGLTETTVCSTFYNVTARDTHSSGHIPIGGPVINNQVYILDQNLRCVPIGCPGELYVAGVGLARGYLANPERTAERFIPNPFADDRRPTTADKETRRQGDKERGEREWSANLQSPISNLQSLDESETQNSKLKAQNSRMYRTGDIARWLPGGVVEFLGRIDQQVKIRGFRIELGEIEAQLRQHPAVYEAAVVAREDLPGDRRLVAYVVPAEGQQPTVSALHGFLREKLPDYMVPTAFMLLAGLPLTPNGKVDIRGLPVPDNLRPDLEVAYTPPRSELERTIAVIWQETLKVEKVGIHDNFFELGGHSLLLVQVHSKLRESFGHLSLIDMFKYPTVNALALFLSPGQPEQPSFDEAQDRAKKQKEARDRRKQLMKERDR